MGSTLSLHWDPVVAMETESKVTGYLVGPDPAPSGSVLVNSGMTLPPSPSLSLAPSQVLLKRSRYNDITSVRTDQTAAELKLSASDDSYLVQVKALSEGGEGAGSEPIHIHRLSESPPGCRGWEGFKWVIHFQGAPPPPQLLGFSVRLLPHDAPPSSTGSPSRQASVAHVVRQDTLANQIEPKHST